MHLRILSLLLLMGCAHMSDGRDDEPVRVSLHNVAGRDVCAVHLWSEDERDRSVENRLLPEQGTAHLEEGSQLLGPTSEFRLHDGSRRDFTVPAVVPLRLEAVDCDGRLVESREIRARAGSVVSLAIIPHSRG
jgi:hypothetical protein